MRHDQVDIVDAEAGLVEGSAHRSLHASHGVLEDRLAFEMEPVDSGITGSVELATGAKRRRHHRLASLAVRTEIVGKHTGAVGAGLVDRRTGAVTEKNAVVTVMVVHQEVQLFGPDHEGALGDTRFDHRRGDRRRVHEAAACCIQIECSSVDCAESLLQEAGVARKRDFRRDRGEHEKIDIGRLNAGRCQRPLRSNFGKIGDLDMADAALVHAGAFDDPLIACVNHLLEIGVGQLHRRHALAPAGDCGAGLRHRCSPPRDRSLGVYERPALRSIRRS